jgi:predicted site-specific integrase-resolvase
MTAKEAGRLLNLSPQTIKFYIRTKKLKAKITPNGYIIKEEDLKTFADKRGK